MKHLFIINPAAGKGKTLKYISHIKKYFEGKDCSYSIKITERPHHATSIASEHLQNGVSRVYSVGGDGTLNEVLNGMVGSESSLAVIPSGSGNDFIKSITENISFDNIVKRMIEGSEMQIDLGKVSNKYFINIASLGFDADVAYNTAKIKGLPGIPGSIAYLLGIFITLFKYRNYDLEIKIDDKSIKSNILLIAIANGRYYGGGMLPAPDAKLDDGLFDICLIKGMPRHKILWLFPRFIKGRHGTISGVCFYRGRRVEIKSKTDISINIDGEVDRVREATFEIIPKGIKVVIPANF